MENVSETIASYLLDIEAVKLRPQDPFKWASGWLSPIYCDNRLTLSFPDIRNYIKNAFLDFIKTHYPQVELIAGVATAGIPQAALVADALHLPFAYVRAEAKKHGLSNQVEGKVQKGQKIVVIEDLVSTGGSSLKAVQALRNQETDVLALLSIMTYNLEKAQQSFAQANLPFHSLCNYYQILREAVKRDLITEEAMASLQEWRKSPENWGYLAK
ncbi:MAG: orotate phosphoribosyltransferase [Raineya sp.]